MSEALPVIDPTPLRNLADSFGTDGPAVVAEMLEIFTVDAPKTLVDFASALDAGDVTTARRAAHTLKTNAATVGAARLQAICRLAEERAAAADLPGAQATLTELEREFALARAALPGPGNLTAGSESGGAAGLD